MLDIKLRKLDIDFFPLADYEKIDKVRKGLSVIGAGSPADDERGAVSSCACEQLSVAELKNINKSRIAKLVLYRKSDHIEFAERIG